MSSSYIVRRLAQALVVLWGAVTFSFAILHLVPGDPVRIMLGGGQGGDASASASPEQVEELRAGLGLDQPLPIQYVGFLRRLVTFDFGTSYATGQEVSSAIARALPVTVELGIAALALTVVLALVFALLGVLLPTRVLRSVFQSSTLVGTAMPSFWVAIILLQVFSFRLGWFPAYGSASLSALVLPALTVALGAAAVMGQVLVRGLRQALDEPYADTARAKGVGHVRLVVVHALRNASLPVFTMVGMLVGGIMSGAVIVETVYGRQGIGLLFVEAIRAKDFPVIQVLIVLSGGLFVLVTLLVDLTYRVIDPRVVQPDGRSLV
jgi:peptide/nickel transport system permease protein